MHPFETLIRQLEFMSANLAHNLDFVPDDKLNWKPAPEAASVMEIINHLGVPLSGMANALKGKWRVEFESATDREEAKRLIVRLAEEYTQTLRALDTSDLGRTVTTPLGDLPLIVAAGVPVIDLIHHHGQIAYIQSLLGDTESHFHQSLTG
ncbi:MAG: hypothetical protein JWN98_1985 [Abditibacteriota bacterium]|nr:hypothetical protein [Abditibacteriota bacterium]